MKKTGFIFGLLLLLASCSQEQLSPSSSNLGESVVRVSLHTSPMKATTTRSTVMPATEADVTIFESDIKHLWAFQFKSTTDGSGQLIKKIKLAVSEPLDIDLIFSANAQGEQSKLYFVVNMGFATFPNEGDMTEAQFKAIVSAKVANEGGFLLQNSATVRRIPMFGECKEPITVGIAGHLAKNLDINLVRMLARVDLVYNVTKPSEFSLQGIRVCNVPNKMNYYRETNAEFVPIYGTDEKTPAIDSSADLMNTNFETTVVNSTTPTKLTYYLPENHRGASTTAVADERLKLGVDNATYFEFVTLAAGNTGGIVTSKFYPGKDNLNDYNLDRNTKYTLTATLTGTGLSNDPRSTDPGKSNCYIVAPGSNLNIPIARVNEGPAGAIASLAASGCTVSVLWQTVNTANYIDLSATPPNCKGGFFNVSVPAGAPEGNAVVCIKNSGGATLWSWHIWVTNYNPMAKAKRLNNILFMDRNLGATTNEMGNVGSYGLYYQWGRKDPFAGPANNTTSNPAAQPLYTGSGAAYTVPTPVATSAASVSDGIVAAIANPGVFYTAIVANANDWIATSAGVRGDFLWGSFKTVYDPCPAGWRMPTNGAWAGLDTKTTDDVAENKWNEFSSFKWSNETTFGGRVTTLGGNYYPASGCRYGSNGTFGSVGSDGYYWSGSVNGTGGSNLNFYGTTVSPSYNLSSRAFGCSARCVQE